MNKEHLELLHPREHVENRRIIDRPHEADIQLLHPDRLVRKRRQPLPMNLIERMQVQYSQTVARLIEEGKEGVVLEVDAAVEVEVRETRVGPVGEEGGGFGGVEEGEGFEGEGAEEGAVDDTVREDVRREEVVFCERIGEWGVWGEVVRTYDRGRARRGSRRRAGGGR